MCSRNHIFLLLLSLFSLSISAQNFTSLKWQDSFVSDQPLFVDALYVANSKLPRYIQNIDLGPDYNNYTYSVKIEYPEFQTLSKSNISFLTAVGEPLASYPQANTRIFVSARKGILEVSFVPLVYRNGEYQRINSFKLTLEKSIAKQKRASSGTNLQWKIIKKAG